MTMGKQEFHMTAMLENVIELDESILHTDSLAKTVDAIDEAYFLDRPIAHDAREHIAHWIAARQGIEGAYGGLFAPTALDMQSELRLFTGEKITSNAGRAHVLGEEACRALVLLAVPDTEDALNRAAAAMSRRLVENETKWHKPLGHYCCTTCSVALWRNLAVGGLSHAEERLIGGMKLLSQRRDGAGRWTGFPFFYTLLALLDVHVLEARSELRYAGEACERFLDRKCHSDDGLYCTRRRLLAERVLESH
jgi:hypothetical protein